MLHFPQSQLLPTGSSSSPSHRRQVAPPPPPSPLHRRRQSSFQHLNLNELSELSAERLNLYIDRQQDAAAGRPQTREGDEAAGVDVTFQEEPKSSRERWKQNFRIALPHVGLVFLSSAYTLLGAAIFHHFETPYEIHIRNATNQRVQQLKDQVIGQLWALAKPPPANITGAFQEWSKIANAGINLVIRDVWIDYTKNYLTPDDIIYGHSPTKWSFGSSIFFSWTAITTIGYGHIVPRTIEGRISCLLYALFGIPLILVTIADMGRFLSGGIKWAHGAVRRVRRLLARRLRLAGRWVRSTRAGRWWAAWRRRRKPSRRKESAQEAPPITTIAVPADETPQHQNGEVAANSLELTANHVGSPPSRPPPPVPPTSTGKGLLGAGLNHNHHRVSYHRAIGARSGGTGRAAYPTLDSISDAGTFEDVSEIQTQHSERTTLTTSADTHARADEVRESREDAVNGVEGRDEEELEDEHTVDEFEPIHQEHRVSVLFILVVMLGYTAGGACLMQLWERWDFMDAFYFCFVTVTTIGFGDIVPQNVDFLPATLCYIIVGLIITTMCIDLVGSEYIRDIHFYGRSLGRSFLTIGGKVVHLGEVFSYVAFLQKNYGLTPDQLDRLAQLPEEYLLDCLINGRQPDLNWIGGRPFIPSDIYYYKWIEQPRSISFTSERLLASLESELDLNTSRCSTARTLTPREYYQRILVHYCKQMQQQNAAAAFASAATATQGGSARQAELTAAIAHNEAIFAAVAAAQACRGLSKGDQQIQQPQQQQQKK